MHGYTQSYVRDSKALIDGSPNEHHVYPEVISPLNLLWLNIRRHRPLRLMNVAMGKVTSEIDSVKLRRLHALEEEEDD